MNANNENIKLQMRKVVDDLIAKKFARGQIMSTVDIGYYLDGWLEDYETDGDVISEEEFGIFLDELEDDLLARGVIYQWGNWESYGMTVLEYGLISSAEHHMMKCRARELKDSSPRTIFENTEFPVDENGRYVRP